MLTERASETDYDFAVRAIPVYFQLSDLAVRHNGIERVTMNLQCLQPDCHLRLSLAIVCLDDEAEWYCTCDYDLA